MSRPTSCNSFRGDFSDYLDGALTGHERQAMALHLEQCAGCSEEFDGLRELQHVLGSLGSAPAPMGLQAQLRGALAAERDAGTHLPWHTRLARSWHATFAPLAGRFAAATVATMLLIGAAGALMMGAPSAVEANDEPLGAMTAPHYLYSQVPLQAIDFGAEAPVLVEARVDNQGRVYDYTIVSGPTDPRVERRVQANLLASVFRPATVFGVAVSGRVVLTYSGVSVRG